MTMLTPRFVFNWQSILGPVVGVGANHGVGVLISVPGLLSIGVSGMALLNRSIRNVEIDLPDQVAAPAPEAQAGQ